MRKDSKSSKQSGSVKSGKVRKSSMKHHRKVNHKDKPEVGTGECVICYNEVDKTTSNSIVCGKKTHILCFKCKTKIISSPCPLCRSHSIPAPVDTTELLVIYSKRTRFGKTRTYQDSIIVLTEEELKRPPHTFN